MLVLELVVTRSAVRRNADDGGAGAGEFGAQAVEVDGFGGAAGRVVLGVEVDHDRLALEILKMRPAAAGGRPFKVGGGSAPDQFLRHNCPRFVSLWGHCRLMEHGFAVG